MKKTLIPTDVAALALGVTPAAIWQAFRRGHLTRYGTAKRALVDLAECQARQPSETA